MSKRIHITITIADDDTGIVEKSAIQTIEASYSYEVERFFEQLCRQAHEMCDLNED